MSASDAPTRRRRGQPPLVALGTAPRAPCTWAPVPPSPTPALPCGHRPPRGPGGRPCSPARSQGGRAGGRPCPRGPARAGSSTPSPGPVPRLPLGVREGPCLRGTSLRPFPGQRSTTAAWVARGVRAYWREAALWNPGHPRVPGGCPALWGMTLVLPADHGSIRRPGHCWEPWSHPRREPHWAGGREGRGCPGARTLIPGLAWRQAGQARTDHLGRLCSAH